MGRTVIDVHILQPVAPSNLNRNNTGSPKSAICGGVRRARVSNQACKRAVRVKFAPILDDAALDERTLPAGEAIAERVMTIAADLRDQVSAMATTVLTAAHSVKDQSNKTHGQSPPQRLSAAWAAGEGDTR